MNVLFLSINVSDNDPRDKITHGFIKKEMEQLSQRGINVFYLSALKNNIREKGITYLSKDQVLEKSAFIRRINNLLFALLNFKWFGLLLVRDIKYVLGIAGVERACCAIVRKYKINIIHTNFFEPSGESAVLTARKYNIPLVATLHGAELRALPEYDYGACLDERYKSMLKKSIQYIDYFTAPNYQLLNMLSNEYNVPDEKLRYVPNGVESIKNKKINYNSDIIQFITISNFIKLKNIEIIVEAIKIGGYCNENFRHIIVGSGPIRNKIAAFLKLNKLDCVEIISEMDKPKLLKLIEESDLLVHSSFSEGMPTVVLESLAIGVPCLVSDISAHQEIVQDGYNGFKFDPDNPKELSEKMGSIISNSKTLEGMKKGCLETASQYTIQKKIDSYLDVYSNLKIK